jgi:Fe-S cluster biogenesis protein NfuA
MSLKVEEKIQKTLAKLAVGIRLDGGDLTLVSFKNGIAKLKISGACLGCPMAAMTFGQGLEEDLKKAVPEIKEIKFV